MASSDPDSGIEGHYDKPKAKPIPKPRKYSAKGSKHPATTSPTSIYTLLHVAPESATGDGHEKILMVFDRSLPSHVSFVISFTGLDSGRKSRAAAKKIGENTILLEAPSHYPAEETKLTVHVGQHEKQICSYVRPFIFKSNLQMIKEQLQKVSDPIEFMCASLHLKKKDTVSLDYELEKLLKRNIPPNFDILKGDDRYRLETVSSPQDNPTLLHFAARYNLPRLALLLIECHGGHRALNVANSDGLIPSHLAHEMRNEKLAEIMAQAQQNPNFLSENNADDIYCSMGDIYEKYYTKIIGSSQVNNGEVEDIYESMTGGESIYAPLPSAEEDDIYVPMNFSCEEEDTSRMPLQETANTVFESQWECKIGSSDRPDGHKQPQGRKGSDFSGLNAGPEDLKDTQSFLNFLQSQSDIGSLPRELAEKIESAYTQLHTIQATDPQNKFPKSSKPAGKHHGPITYADVGSKNSPQQGLVRSGSTGSQISTTSSSSSSSSRSAHSASGASGASDAEDPRVKVPSNTGPEADGVSGPRLDYSSAALPPPPPDDQSPEARTPERPRRAGTYPKSDSRSDSRSSGADKKFQTLPRKMPSRGELTPILPPRRKFDDRAPLPLPEDMPVPMPTGRSQKDQLPVLPPPRQSHPR